MRISYKFTEMYSWWKAPDLFQAPESFYRVRSWLSMAVVALTSGGNGAEASERGKHRSSSTSSPPRRELHAACLCLDEPVSRTVTSGRACGPSALSLLVSRPALRPLKRRVAGKISNLSRVTRTESNPNVTYAELWQRPSGKSRPTADVPRLTELWHGHGDFLFITAVAAKPLRKFVWVSCATGVNYRSANHFSLDGKYFV